MSGPAVREGVTGLVGIVAMCGSEVRTWEIEVGELPVGESFEVELTGLEDLADLTWASFGVQVAVRLTVMDTRSGEALDFASAPDRWIQFADGALLQSTSEEQVAELSADLAVRVEDHEEIDAILPPDVVYLGVE